MEETFRKWAALGKDANVIAQGLYQASEGKVTKLNCRNWHDEDSVWEKALKFIFPGQRNTQRDRFFLWSCWIHERKGVFVEYQKLRGKPLTRNIKTTQDQVASQSQGSSQKDQGHCFCQRSYKLVKNVPMLQCDQCQAWWHGICADKNAMEFQGDRTFICDLCNGRAIIPPIFEETPKSSPAGTSHGREFVEHKTEGMTTPKRSQERRRSSKNTTEEDGDTKKVSGRTLFKCDSTQDKPSDDTPAEPIL